MKELLTKLGINDPGYFSATDDYVIDISNSDSYNRIFGKLDKSSLVEEDEESSAANIDVSNIMYRNEKYSLNLIADFNDDTYKLIVHEMRREN